MNDLQKLKTICAHYYYITAKAPVYFSKQKQKSKWDGTFTSSKKSVIFVSLWTSNLTYSICHTKNVVFWLLFFFLILAIERPETWAFLDRF
jgi:hypothetical protein